ncbi:hypothetical protein DXG01_010854 [Tephrocybe rancida]|nr:hypothetical protein DXG01_010854 [Tephrocybe rancida]
MSTRLTFTTKDILNSRLEPAHGSTSYQIDTTRGLLGRKTTSLSPLSGIPFNGVPGAIKWHKAQFDVNDEKRKWSNLQHRTGLFSSSRRWQWTGSFKVKYRNNQWTVSLQFKYGPQHV